MGPGTSHPLLERAGRPRSHERPKPFAVHGLLPRFRPKGASWDRGRLVHFLSRAGHPCSHERAKASRGAWAPSTVSAKGASWDCRRLVRFVSGLAALAPEMQDGWSRHVPWPAWRSEYTKSHVAWGHMPESAVSTRQLPGCLRQRPREPVDTVVQPRAIAGSTSRQAVPIKVQPFPSV
jgi:hypothetical protein